MMRPAVLAIVAVVLLATVALARQGVVKTRSGQTYSGDIEEKGDGVVVNKSGIQTRIPQNEIASITYPEDFDKEFGQRLAKLEKNDAKGRVQLAREAFENGRYKLARDVLEEALTIDPNNTEAAELRDAVSAQIRLERAKQNPPATAETRVERPATTTAAADDRRFLKPADINAIRQVELREDETNIPIRFEHDVNRRYAKQLAKRPPAEFLSLTPIQQAIEILRDGPPEMRQDLIIRRDPRALMEYRRLVQPYVLQNCATSQCHGGPAGGTLQLFVPAETDPVTYTDFFILQDFTKNIQGSGGIFSKGQLHMIDRMQPAKSLLLEYSIPKNLSEYDHPDVANYRPPLRGPDDSRYRLILDWIGNSLLPDSNYGIEYHPPGATSRPAATRPATRTAAIRR